MLHNMKGNYGTNMFTTLLLIIILSLQINISHASAEKSQLEEYMQYIKEEGQIIYISTRSLRYLYDAPAIVTVISREQILNSGAKKLVDILKHVPGFGITDRKSVV